MIMAAGEVGVSAGTGVSPTAVTSQILYFSFKQDRPYDFRRYVESEYESSDILRH